MPSQAYSQALALDRKGKGSRALLMNERLFSCERDKVEKAYKGIHTERMIKSGRKRELAREIRSAILTSTGQIEKGKLVLFAFVM